MSGVDPPSSEPANTFQATVFSAEITDLEQLRDADSTVGVQVDYFQLEPGPYSASIHWVLTESVCFFSERYGRKTRFVGTLPDNVVGLGLFSGPEPARWCGTSVQAPTLALLPPAAQVDLVLAGGSHSSILFVPCALWDELAIGTAWDRLLRLDATGLVALEGVLERVEALRQEDCVPERIEALIAETLTALQDAAREQPTRTKAQERTRKLVQSCEALALQKPKVQQLAKLLRVSERTLHYAFQHERGLSPKAQLRALRLNEARRDLLAGDPSEDKVSTLAQAWGFTHMGHFATAYKKFFGESPSVTLQTPRPSLSRLPARP